MKDLTREGIFVFPEGIDDVEDIDGNQMILWSENANFCTGNIVGFLGYKQERLTICSRFSSDNCDYFFQYMLERVLNLPNIMNFNIDTNKENEIYQLLIFLFPYYLKKALRKGIYRTYIRRKYNDNNLKGSVDIPRHIKHNIPFTGYIAYNQREISYDNDLMELIRHTIEFILKKPFGNQLLRAINDEINIVIEVTPSYNFLDRGKLLYRNKTKPIQHAYFHEYRALQRLSIMILQQERHQVGVGRDFFQGILFDCSWFWEEYINLLIQDYFYHPINKAGKGKQDLFSKSFSPYQKVGWIYPDFISKKESKEIGDAKYKPFENINSKDYLQILAYMYRFKAKKGYFLYPESHVDKKYDLYLNSGSTFDNNVQPREDIIVKKHGLKIPMSAKCYESFVDEIKQSEKEFLLEFNEL